MFSGDRQGRGLKEQEQGSNVGDRVMALNTVQFEVEVKTKALVHVWIDGKKVPLGNGKGSRDTGTGNHTIAWNVIGPPGTSYTIRITAPPEARLVHTRTLDADLQDIGFDWFRID